MYKIILPLLCLFAVSNTAAQSEAIYTVTFDSNWSQSTHPHSSGSLPNGAHWSKLVGATHNSGVTFLEMGGFATQGIEDIAEQGNNTEFFSEVDEAVSNGFADSAIDGDNLNTSLGQIVISDITVSEEYPLLTLLSMIAPSPDWMIAINSISLQDGDGEWIDEIIIDLYPYDAGTDSGTDYTSSNNNTFPQDPISSLQGITPFSNAIIGTMTITLDSVILGVNDAITNTLTIYPNPTTNFLNITSGSKIESVEVFNALGKKVMDESIDSDAFQIDVSNLPSGFYLISMTSEGNETAVKRFVKR
ncbi:MAG: T9SS type A sorting domain-containing protein [Flavobacteriaceae bacterium]|nr:T9SS type A sorting domain-containing protein [Flavobacteriaceae bacterium]